MTKLKGKAKAKARATKTKIAKQARDRHNKAMIALAQRIIQGAVRAVTGAGEEITQQHVDKANEWASHYLYDVKFALFADQGLVLMEYVDNTEQEAQRTMGILNAVCNLRHNYPDMPLDEFLRLVDMSLAAQLEPQRG